MILRRCPAIGICFCNEFCGWTRRIFYNSRTTGLHNTSTVYFRKLLLDQNFRFLQQVIGGQIISKIILPYGRAETFS